MASQRVSNGTSGSRLTQMQLRFQHKQMQEREQKRTELTPTSSTEISQGATPKMYTNGRVRQMFDERRRGAGIDRSNPLKPIGGYGTSSSMTAIKTKTSSMIGGRTINVDPNGTYVRRTPVNATSNFVANKRSPNGNYAGASYHKRHSDMDDVDSIDEKLSQDISSISLTTDLGDRNNNNNHKRYDIPSAKSTFNIKLKPILSKRSPQQPVHVMTAKVVGPSNSVQRALNRATHENSGKSNPPSKTSSTKFQSPQVRNSKPQVSRGNSSSVRPPYPPPPGMAACSYCGRNFLEERLLKHEDVCRKVTNTKRKVFDTSKKRVQGTGAEKYVAKAKVGGTRGVSNSTVSVVSKESSKKNNWRKKHEDFIAAIRAAKQLQQHLARGGKVTDLPPPPPTENPDYIQCPHCMRRFNEAAAERHIPKCATMLHNKPKPGASKRR